MIILTFTSRIKLRRFARLWLVNSVYNVTCTPIDNNIIIIIIITIIIICYFSNCGD